MDYEDGKHQFLEEVPERGWGIYNVL
jgi:hypothetical protein